MITKPNAKLMGIHLVLPKLPKLKPFIVASNTITLSDHTTLNDPIDWLFINKKHRYH